MDIDAMVHPCTASPAVWALDYQLVQHRLDDFGHRTYIVFRLDMAATGRTCLTVVGLGCPSMLEAVAAEVMLTWQLNRLIEGGVTNQTHKVAISCARVLEGRHFGRHF